MKQKFIKDCHVFNHHGVWYVINIEEMSAYTIDYETAMLIKNTVPDVVLQSHISEKLKKYGLLSEGREEILKKEREPVFITNICLFLTRSCNLNCIYCYEKGRECTADADMEEHTAFQAIDWLIEQSGKIKKIYAGLFGGEPFLKFPLMKSVVEYAKKRAGEAGKKIVFYVTTNGTLLDDEKIAFIKEHTIDIMVSFDGTKELQDSQRPFADGRGSYDSSVPGIKKLLEALPETPGHAVIVGNTDPEIVKNSMKEIGFKHISIIPASKSLFTEEYNKTKSRRDTAGILNELEKEGETWVKLVKNRDSEGLKSLKERSELYQVIVFLLHNNKRHYACGAGLGFVAVSCSGDVYLCQRFVGMEEYKLGSIFEKDVRRDEYQKSPVTDNKLCTSCFARYCCAGGCKHDNAASCGSVSRPSEDMCRLRRRELELAASIVCRLTSDDMVFLTDGEIFPRKPCLLDF
ncbi:MAG: nif11-like peptide radical SAM maturase [Candidatus Eremiobacterota bacterium]